MKYFWDHETDSVSFDLSDIFDFAATEEVGPNVTLHLDRFRRPMAVEVRNASRLLNTLGLIPLRETAITREEISLRMSKTEEGQLAWRSIVRRMLVPDYALRATRGRETPQAAAGRM